MVTNIERSENHKDICKFENYDRIANYRCLKVGNCHLKNTNYEYCGMHRPKWSINKRFPYRTIFDQHEINLKYYNQSNEHIANEYYNYILNLYQNHNFGFPIKTTVFTENLLYNIKEIDDDNEIDVTNITSYKKYFNTNSVKVKDIYNIILEFNGYYNDKKIEMVNIYNTIQDIAKELNIEFDSVLKLFKSKFNNNDICVSSTKNDFFELDHYENQLNKFDEFDYSTKESLSEFLNFDKKYDRSVYLQICNLISCQIDKVTKSFEILSENDVETVLNEIIKNMDDNFQKISPDTKYKFLCFKKVEVNIFKYQALKRHVGSYIELPISLQRQGLINIKNNDNYCFIWSYIRYINPQNKNPNRIKLTDKKLFNEIKQKLINFKFPLEINKTNIKKIEDILKINICILTADEKENVYPMFSSENNHESDLNLFYYMNHICLIKDINKYLYRNNKHKDKKYFCVRCLNSFNSVQNLNKHKELCAKYNTQSEKLVLPNENSILKFNKINEMIKTPFTIYYDIETYGQYLKKQKKKIQNTTHEQLLKPYLIGYILKNNYDDKFSKKCQIFIGDQCIEKCLLNLIFTERPYINKIIDENFNKPIECNPDLSKFNINLCHLCNENIENNPVKNHCHYSGKMLGYAHNECNLQYKFKKDNVHNDYLINIFGHNSQNFDQSFLIRALQNLDNRISFSCLPRNSNKFISIQIGPFIFKDSYLFLSKSLDYLTGTIDDNNRISLKQEFGKENYKLLTKKGIYPYDYFDSKTKYDELQLPEKEKFFNKLNNKNISNEDYKHALNVFKTFKCKDLLDYSILYLKTDICHLSDVFQKFSNFAHETYNIDPRHSYTLPGFSWQSMLKMTKIELELISDSDMYLYLMDCIRGGICVVNKKFVKADNIYTRKVHDESSDKKVNKKLKTSNSNKFIMYLDANNLYGHSMSKPLPYKNFKWSDNLTLDPKNLQTGIYEVDIEIPKELHDKFVDYPLCPEIKNIPEDMLSEYQKYLNDKLNIKYNEKDKKLILDLLSKKNYKVYYKNLEYYLKLGLKVTKVHRILIFDEKPFLKEYIDLNTELRKQSKNDLEKDLFKLMNNAIFGKSMENVLNRSNIKLVNNNPEKLLKLIKQPNFENAYQISNRLCIVESKPIKTVFNKPIFMGAVILETSKLHMYEFWYDYLKVKYDNKIKLIYTDTDSFVIEVETDDIYKDMYDDKHLYDFSDYPKDHPNYSLNNKKVYGIFKDELNGKMITEFVADKPKMYSYEYIDNYTILNKNKHKGIKISVDLKHNEYKRALYKEELIYKNFYNLQLNKQKIYLDKINKIALNPFDCKRHWLNNIESVPYGYKI